MSRNSVEQNTLLEAFRRLAGEVYENQLPATWVLLFIPLLVLGAIPKYLLHMQTPLYMYVVVIVILGPLHYYLSAPKPGLIQSLKSRIEKQLLIGQFIENAEFMSSYINQLPPMLALVFKLEPIDTTEKKIKLLIRNMYHILLRSESRIPYEMYTLYIYVFILICSLLACCVWVVVAGSNPASFNAMISFMALLALLMYFVMLRPIYMMLNCTRALRHVLDEMN